MKIKILICSLFLAGIASAQIGINTDIPKTLFHVDAKSDNSTAGMESDDFVVTSAGRVGIGTQTPDTKLHIVGKMRIVNGFELAGRVLVSDADGYGKWAEQPKPDVVYSNSDVVTELSTHPISSNLPVFVGPSITLPPGDWQITFSANYGNSSSVSTNIVWDLCTSSTAHTFDDALYARRVFSGGASTGHQMPTLAIYFVSVRVTTTYYLWAYSVQSPGVSLQFNTLGSAYLYAFPVGG